MLKDNSTSEKKLNFPQSSGSKRNVTTVAT